MRSAWAYASRAAGPQWTEWILSEMRQVRGSVAEEPNGGRWGIVDALPPDVAKVTSIKNGWTLIYADGMGHMNCLAIHEDWILAVLTRFPGNPSKQHGADLCKGVTEQLMTRCRVGLGRQSSGSPTPRKTSGCRPVLATGRSDAGARGRRARPPGGTPGPAGWRAALHRPASQRPLHNRARCRLWRLRRPRWRARPRSRKRSCTRDRCRLGR